MNNTSIVTRIPDSFFVREEEEEENILEDTFLLLYLRGPSAYAYGSTSALWLIVLSLYWTFQLSPPVPRCYAP
jgi:hypothetical protein